MGQCPDRRQYTQSSGEVRVRRVDEYIGLFTSCVAQFVLVYWLLYRSTDMLPVSCEPVHL